MPQNVVLFHSALGLRPSVVKFDDRLRTHGHEVHTPDLFESKVFDALDDGVQLGDSLGIPRMVERASEQVAALPETVVYAGFSLGAAAAHCLPARVEVHGQRFSCTGPFRPMSSG